MIGRAVSFEKCLGSDMPIAFSRPVLVARITVLARAIDDLVLQAEYSSARPYACLGAMQRELGALHAGLRARDQRDDNEGNESAVALKAALRARDRTPAHCALRAAHAGPHLPVHTKNALPLLGECGATVTVEGSDPSPVAVAC